MFSLVVDSEHSLVDKEDTLHFNKYSHFHLYSHSVLQSLAATQIIMLWISLLDSITM